MDEKSNEITAIPLPLETLDLLGSIVTIDAMGTQRKITQMIGCTGSGCLDTILRSGSKCQERCLTGFDGGLEAQFFETPFAIVSILERDAGSTNFFNVFEQPPVDSYASAWSD